MTCSKPSSDKWRAQIQKLGFASSKTLEKKRDEQAWEAHLNLGLSLGVSHGYRPIPKEATVEHLINKYEQAVKQDFGRTKAATLSMLKREIGSIKLDKLITTAVRSIKKENHQRLLLWEVSVVQQRRSGCKK